MLFPESGVPVWLALGANVRSRDRDGGVWFHQNVIASV